MRRAVRTPRVKTQPIARIPTPPTRAPIMPKVAQPQMRAPLNPTKLPVPEALPPQRILTPPEEMPSMAGMSIPEEGIAALVNRFSQPRPMMLKKEQMVQPAAPQDELAPEMLAPALAFKPQTSTTAPAGTTVQQPASEIAEPVGVESVQPIPTKTEIFGGSQKLAKARPTARKGFVGEVQQSRFSPDFIASLFEAFRRFLV